MKRVDCSDEAWLIDFAPGGVQPHPYNLRVLAHAGGASLRPMHTVDKVALRQLGPEVPGRLSLVQAIHQTFHSHRLEGASPRTIASGLTMLRKFWKFCDASNQHLELDFRVLKTAVDNWNSARRKMTMRGEISEHTANQENHLLCGTLSRALGISSQEFSGRRHSTRRPKLQSSTYENFDLKAVGEFINDLDAICNAINEKTLLTPWPLPILLSDGQVIYYSQGGMYGAKPEASINPDALRLRKKRHKLVSIALRRRAMTVRMHAEFLRFIAFTGMNLTQTNDLEISDVNYRSLAGEYVVTGFKDRSGSSVQFSIPKSYRQNFNAWISFRQFAFSWSNAKMLFPFLNNKGKEISHGANRGFRTIVDLMCKASKPYFSPRQLRYFRAQKSLRTVVTASDIRQVASDLQHSLPTLLQSYTTGSMASATTELGRYLATIPALARAKRVRAGGVCVDSRNTPRVIKQASKVFFDPDCIHPAGCYFCRHFRAEVSTDGIHAMLSYKAYLRIRAGSSPGDATSWNAVRPIIERIDLYIHKIVHSSAESAQLVQLSEARIARGDLHPLWRGWAELISDQ